MKLRDYLQERGISFREMQKITGIHAAQLCNYCNGGRIPRPYAMKAIYQGTEGKVQPNDFYDINFIDEESDLNNLGRGDA